MINSLKRSEIIRGYGVYEEILTKSKRLISGNLAAHLNISEYTADLPVKVGFLLSKKKLKKRTTGTVLSVC